MKYYSTLDRLCITEKHKKVEKRYQLLGHNH